MNNIKEIIKGIDGVFKLPKKKYYCGKIAHYTPYFEPMGFSRSIIKVRKLIPLSDEELAKNMERGYGWTKIKWKNMPMVRRTKDYTIKLFGNSYWVQIGKPWAIVRSGLGYKDKHQMPRYEWPAFFHIWFFNWQFCITWVPPVDNYDKYWEMVLWYLFYYDEYGTERPDIIKARKSWGWADMTTKESTWDDSYLI